MQEQNTSMHFEEGTFKGVEGNSIYYQCRLPDAGTKASLLLVHGLAEHGGRYGNIVDHFVPRGYAVYSFDLPGHGKSGGRRCFIQSFQEYIDTLKTFRDMVSRWQSGKPLFLLGHSMGGLIAAVFLIDRPQDVNGAVLSAPAVSFPEDISPRTIFIGKVLSSIAPRMGLTKLDAAAISRDTAVVAEYESDPMVHHGKVSARLGAEILRAMERVALEAGTIMVPLLIMQGGDDRLVSPAGAKMLYEKAGTTDKMLKTYDGLYHEIFNEPERERVLQDTEQWLEERLPSQP